MRGAHPPMANFVGVSKIHVTKLARQNRRCFTKSDLLSSIFTMLYDFLCRSSFLLSLSLFQCLQCQPITGLHVAAAGMMCDVSALMRNSVSGLIGNMLRPPTFVVRSTNTDDFQICRSTNRKLFLSPCFVTSFVDLHHAL